MKSFVSSSVAIAAVLSSPGVESFAPPSASRRVAIIAPSAASVHVHQHHQHDGQKRPPSSYLFASNDGPTSDEDAANGSTPSRQSRFLSNIRRKSKPITLALLTATSATFLPSGSSSSLRNLLIPPAKASAPIVLRENAKKEDPPMVQAMKKAEKLKKQRSMEEFDAFMARANDIEETDGKAARDEYEKQYQLEKEAREAQKKVDVELLKRKLLDEGQDPNTDVDAERQVFLLEHDVDLEKISGTPQNERMIKNFQKRGKGLPTYKNQRYIIACQVADLKARGIDPMEHFSDPDVMDKTRAIYRMDDKVAEKVAKQYETLMNEHGGRLTPAKEGEVPFVYSAESAAASGAAVASSAADAAASLKEEKAAARAAAKAKRAAEKEAALEAKAKAREERAEAKAKAKADRAAAKEAKLAEKAAGAAAALAAKEAAAAATTAAATVATAMDDAEVAATANGDISASAGNNAVAKSSMEVTQQQTTKSSSTKAKDVLATAKSYATPRNAATVLIGGGAAVYGFNYYQENSASAQSERERQLKLILGTDDEDEDEDDDEFDDDDEEDAFEQFTKKKPAAPKSTPKSEDSSPKESKPVAPPTPPAVPAPKPKRKLGIFAKRNANARETDLNAMVGPNAQAPEFATLLAQILTFGAPGRFPAVAAWGGMPFEEFDLDKAKSLLMESRANADLTDEQSAEIFASVVNCMIIDIVDLASATLKGKDKDDKMTVDAINVVMDFMDHAASLFDAVAKDVTIKPVTYGGNLRKKDLEQMFSVYAGSSMMSLDGTGTKQDRVDTLQLVFAITDKKAEGLMQKHMMKMMMDLMKDGGKGLEGMPGMEGMEDMMKAMGGAGGMMPGMDGEISPEELKQTVGMMKELMDSGQVSEEELAEVRGQFKEMYGSDIADLIKKADEEGAGEGMTDDERELLDMFKTILGE